MAGKTKKMMETSAVYWEPKIKIYGFHEVSDLSLLEATVKTKQITLIGSLLSDLDDSEINFNLILIQTLKAHTSNLYLVFDRKWEGKVQRYFDSILQKESEESFLIRSPVELIYFFGPHFGERYGIADTIFQVLLENNLSILAAGFSGSAVYLVLPENGIEKVRPVLSSAFEVPKSK
ncbi:MAG: hypothetical protein R6X10_16780 [Desulfobacterales bacterium]